jgi:DNA polymerase elongation subunit (family B)
MLRGISAIRRDSCELAQKCVKDTLQAVLHTPDDRVTLLKPLETALAKLVDPNVPITLLQRSVAKKAAYKGGGDKLIQKVLFDKIQRRTGVDIEPGTRVSYVVTLPNEGKKNLRGKDDKFWRDGQEVSFCVENGIRPDRAYIVEKQLQTPLVRYIGNLIPPEEIKKRTQKAIDMINAQNSKNTTLSRFVRTTRTS